MRFLVDMPVSPRVAAWLVEQSAEEMVGLLERVLEASSPDDLQVSICVVDRRRIRYRRLPVAQQ